MTKYGRSPWIDQVKKSRVPSYPKYRGASTAEVVIVGGGLTGCATAYALSAAGVKAIVLEADQIGRGTTAASAGWMGDEPGVGFAELEKALGLRDARRGWQAWHRAGLDFAALLRRLNIKCALEPLGSTTAARSLEQAQRLKREQKARRAAGIDAPLLNARAISGELGFPALAGIRARDGATIDPYRAAVGLARCGGRARRAILRALAGHADHVRPAGRRSAHGRRPDPHDAGGRRDRRADGALQGSSPPFLVSTELFRADRAGPGEDSPGRSDVATRSFATRRILRTSCDGSMASGCW